MNTEMIRFQNAVQANPKIIDQCLRSEFGIDGLVKEAKELGYRFDRDDVYAHLKSLTMLDDTIARVTYKNSDGEDISRELTWDELDNVSGGLGVAATVVAVVEIAVAVEAVAVVGPVLVVGRSPTRN